MLHEPYFVLLLVLFHRIFQPMPQQISSANLDLDHAHCWLDRQMLLHTYVHFFTPWFAIDYCHDNANALFCNDFLSKKRRQNNCIRLYFVFSWDILISNCSLIGDLCVLLLGRGDLCWRP